MRKTIAFTLLLALLTVGHLTAQETKTPTQICEEATPAEDPATRQYDAPEQVLEDGVDYQAVFCTALGPVYVDLYEDRTPQTVNNFVFLAQNGYYNNSTFHRVISDFMAQGGDPVGNPPGTGGPGYQFEDEFVADLNFDRPGLLAMANAGPNTNGSQFFITTVATDWLNQQHTIFGEVLTGQNVVISIPDNQNNPALQTELYTVVIVTDPASVEMVEFVPEPATREDFDATFAELPEKVSEIFVGSLTADPDLTGVSTAEDISNADLQTYYESHGLEYRAVAAIENAACDLEGIPLEHLNYDIDVYPTAEDAAAALEDSALADLQTADELTLVENTSLPGYTVYSGTVSACDIDDLIFLRGFKQTGRYVVTMEITVVGDAFPAELSMGEIADVLIQQLSEPFESFLLADVLRPEIR